MTIATLIAKYGIAAIFVGAGIEGETVVVTGGLLARHHLVAPWAAGVAAAAGSFVADQLFFLAGRRFRDMRRVKAIRAKPAFARALAALERHPIGFILAFRFIYGLRTISPVAIGTSRVPTRTFVPLNAIAAAAWGAAFTTIGYVFGHGLETIVARVLPRGHMIRLAGAVGVLAIVAIGVTLYLRRRVNRS